MTDLFDRNDKRKRDFNDLVFQIRPQLYAAALCRTGGDAATAEDLVQKALLAAWQKQDATDIHDLLAYLRKCVVNSWRDFCRQKQSRREEPLPARDILMARSTNSRAQEAQQAIDELVAELQRTQAILEPLAQHNESDPHRSQLRRAFRNARDEIANVLKHLERERCRQNGGK